MSKSSSLLRAVAAFTIAVSVRAQPPPKPAAKPTLESVTKDLKTSSDAQAAAASKAVNAANASRTAQSETLNKVLLQQAQAETTNLKSAKEATDNAALAQYKQEERLMKIELVLTQEEEDKKLERQDAKRSHDELMNRGSEVAVGLFIALVVWAVSGVYGLVIEGRRHRNLVVLEAAHTASLRIQDAKLDQIHTLVNSNLTTALESELESHQATLAALLELAAERPDPNPAAVATTVALRLKIANLTAHLSERRAAAGVAPA